MTGPFSARNLQELITQHLRRDFNMLLSRQTVAEALTTIRERQLPGRIVYFYVLDDSGRLAGVVPTRRLLLSPLDKRVGDIMDQKVIAIPHTATVLDACEFFTMHRLLAFPVVDESRHMIGVVDVELYTEELEDIDRSQQSNDLFQLIGVQLAQAQQASHYQVFRNRFPWLLCNVAAGTMAAFLAGLFEGELQRAVALALFIPVVLALAESVTVQSISLALQSLHGERPSLKSLFLKLRRESVNGLLLGTAVAAVVGLVSILWLGQFRVTLCIVFAITGGVLASAIVGTAMPHLVRLLQRDPRVAAGPIALAMADLITLWLYLNCARWLLA
jgi:magnesium transporter